MEGTRRCACLNCGREDRLHGACHCRIAQNAQFCRNCEAHNIAVAQRQAVFDNGGGGEL